MLHKTNFVLLNYNCNNRHQGIHRVLKSGELPPYCFCNLIPYVLLLQFNWELQKFQRWGSHVLTSLSMVWRAVGTGGPGGCRGLIWWLPPTHSLLDQWTLFQQGGKLCPPHYNSPPPDFQTFFTALKKRMWVASFLLIDLRDFETKRIKNERILFNNAYGLLCWLESLLFAFRKVTMIFQNRLNKGKGKSRTPWGNSVVSR